MRHTTTPPALLRPARPGDGRQVARYSDLATHGHKPSSWLQGLAHDVDSSAPDDPFDRARKVTLSSRITGTRVDTHLRPYLRMLDLGEPAASGMIYSAQPMDWIAKDTRLPVRIAGALMDAFVEVNMLAVHERHRGRGHASALLADTEDHYRALGFTTAMVVVDYDDDPTLRPWYERRGYLFSEPGERALIQPYAADRNTRRFYTAISDAQITGFKALDPA